MVAQSGVAGSDAALGNHFARQRATNRRQWWPWAVLRAGMPRWATTCAAALDISAAVVAQGGLAGWDAALGYHFVHRSGTYRRKW